MRKGCSPRREVAHESAESAVVRAIIAGIAAILGFTNIVAGAADIARILFFLFLAGVVILVILGLFVYKSVT
jgi:uncharacterized membrane protein YtjA (UPF0391 family)